VTNLYLAENMLTSSWKMEAKYWGALSDGR